MKKVLCLFTLILALFTTNNSDAQSPKLKMQIHTAGSDSVVIRLILDNTNSLTFTCEGVQAAVAYNPSIINPMPPPPKLPGINIHEHFFAQKNWTSFSDPLLEADLVDPDISFYAEATFGGGVPAYNIGNNQIIILCRIKWYPLSASGSVTLSYSGNTGASGLTGYNKAGVIDLIAFASVTGITVFFPVELSGLRATSQGSSVAVEWTTASETNNFGFEIYRRLKTDAIRIDDDGWQKIDFVKGRGTTSERTSYMTIDRDIKKNGLYQYRLKQIDHDGTFTYSPITEVPVDLTPTAFNLQQNYPNPVNLTAGGNTSALIRYQLPEASPVQIKVYNQLGKKIQTLVDDMRPAGTYTAEFYTLGFPSGMYYYKMTAGKFSSMKKMLLVR